MNYNTMCSSEWWYQKNCFKFHLHLIAKCDLYVPKVITPFSINGYGPIIAQQHQKGTTIQLKIRYKIYYKINSNNSKRFLKI